MDYRFIKASTLTDIADALRAKTGKTGTIDPATFASLIDQLELGITPTGQMQIYKNGEYDITEFSKVIIEVAQPQLYSPSISLSGTMLTIANKASNGSFVERYELYEGGTLLGIYEGTYTTIDLSQLNLSDGTHTLTVVATGTGFVDSPLSNTASYTTHFTFSIDGTTYQAMHGWTWEDFIGSTYNTAGYKETDEGYITNSAGTHRVEDEEMGAVTNIEYIDEDSTYILKAITFAFTIDGTAYYAEVRMVFADWIDSSYNTGGFVSDGGTITTADGTGIELNGTAVAEEDEIMQGGAYELGMTQLTTPTIEIDGTTLNIYDEEGLATSYDILVDGVVMDSVSAVSLISFTIDGTSYEAEEGMTWAEWCDSDYNTGGYYISGTTVVPKTNYYVSGATSTDTITNGTAYTVLVGGGAAD